MTENHLFAPLPSELRRRIELAEQEAVRGIQWRDDCPPEVGRKVLSVLRRATNAIWRVFHLAEEHWVAGSSSAAVPTDIESCLKGHGSAVDRLDALAAVVYSFVELSQSDEELVEGDYGSPDEVPRYERERFLMSVNDLLLAARVEWHYNDRSFVQRGNSVLYSDIVKPTTILLDSSPVFAKASRRFNAAISRLSENKPDAAITDAASAVQEMLRALGANGNSITDQIDAAARQKIITQVDRQLLRPIVNWVNADRSERGNAHHHRADDASKADAWLAIHVAGALMVRLSNQEPRDILAAHAQREQAEASRADKAREPVLEEPAEESDPWALPPEQAVRWQIDEPPF